MVHAAAARNNKGQQREYQLANGQFSVLVGNKVSRSISIACPAARAAHPLVDFPQFSSLFRPAPTRCTPHFEKRMCGQGPRGGGMCKTSQNTNRNNGYLQTATGLIGVNSTLQQHW